MTQDFVTWMKAKAEQLKSDAAHGGEHHDGGCQKILETLEAYEVGKGGYDSTMIPSLQRFHKQFAKKTDDEWAEFQRLADKFGVRV